MAIRIYHGDGVLWDNAKQKPLVNFYRGSVAVEDESIWGILDALGYRWSEPPMAPLPIPPDGSHLIMCPDGVVQPNLPYVQFAGCNVVSYEDLGVTVITPSSGGGDIGTLVDTVTLSGTLSITMTAAAATKGQSIVIYSNDMEFEKLYNLMNGGFKIFYKLKTEVITPITTLDKVVVYAANTGTIANGDISGTVKLGLGTYPLLWSNNTAGTATIEVMADAEFYK